MSWYDQSHIGGVLMEWTQVLTILGGNLAMFLWATRQSRTDYLHLSKILEGIQSEMKDFHGRLCAIEERNKGK